MGTMLSPKCQIASNPDPVLSAGSHGLTESAQFYQRITMLESGVGVGAGNKNTESTQY